MDYQDDKMRGHYNTPDDQENTKRRGRSRRREEAGAFKKMRGGRVGYCLAGPLSFSRSYAFVRFLLEP